MGDGGGGGGCGCMTFDFATQMQMVSIHLIPPMLIKKNQVQRQSNIFQNVEKHLKQGK